MFQDRRIPLGYMVCLCFVYLKWYCLKDFGTGHLWWWQREEATVVEKNLLNEFGAVVRWNGALGVRFCLA